MTDESTKIFQALKTSGENFFDNKEELDQIRKESENLYNTEKKRINEEVSINSCNFQSLFDSLQLNKPSDIEYESRRNATPEENKLIEDACQLKESPRSTVDDIKHALGFTSKCQIDKKFKKPCVAVVGQTKAGKSSLINAFLGCKTVPQKLTRQTARVTYITYCQTKFVAYLKDKTLKSIVIGEDVKNQDVDLKFDERSLADKVGIEIRVGAENPLLKNDFDIVDSPGLNENRALNELCQNMEKSLLPLLIFVIDGRNGLTESDITDIKNIRERTPKIKILYFVTKLVRSKLDMMKYKELKEEKNVGPNNDLPGESDIDVAKRRLNNVFIKLQKNHFIPPSQERTKCNYFNGADLAAIQSFRISENEPSSAEIDLYTVESFRKFEVDLLEYLRNMIEQPLKDDLANLKLAFENFLENSTICGTDIVEEKHLKLKCLEKFQSDEEELYVTQSKEIENQLHSKIKDMLDQYERSVLHLIQDCPQTSQYQLEQFVERSLQTQMEDFIENFMLKVDEQLVDELTRIVSKLCSGNYGLLSFSIMLKNRLFLAYDLTEECSLSDKKDYNLKPSRRENKNKIISSIRESFQNINLRRNHASQLQNDENPNDPSWREQKVKNILSELDKENFINKVCCKVTKELKNRHTAFTDNLKKERNFLNDKLNLGEKDKDNLKEVSKNVAILFLRVYIVETNIHIALDPIRQPEKITTGGQATIDKVYLVGDENPIVRKTYFNTFPDFKSSFRVRSLGLEVYYTSRLKDSNFLPLLGIKKESNENGFKFSSFYPFIPNGSLKDYLENHDLDISTRVSLAISIANGLQCLHGMKIIHRDVTLKNFLVDGSIANNLKVIIADFGVLNSLAFASNQQVGTPFYYAPETYYPSELRKTGYTFECDVFSFGISLWQLLSYKLRPEYNNFEPKFVSDCEYNKEKIRELIDNGVRPEKRDIPPGLNSLIERCWSAKVEERLSFSQPQTNIFPTLIKGYSDAGKTICEILQEIYNRL